MNKKRKNEDYLYPLSITNININIKILYTY